MDGCCIAAILAKKQGPCEQHCGDILKKPLTWPLMCKCFKLLGACNTCQARGSPILFSFSPNDLPF